MMTLECDVETADGEGFSLEELGDIAASLDPPSQALTEMVRRIANQLELDVCSVYILEENRQHLCLAATMGLNQASVGCVRMKISEGLAGMVAEKRQSISVAAAQKHPRFKYFPEAGEEKYNSFHGRAVIDDEQLQGVFVAQTVDARDFSSSEVELIGSFAEAIAPYVRHCRSIEYL